MRTDRTGVDKRKLQSIGRRSKCVHAQCLVDRPYLLPEKPDPIRYSLRMQLDLITVPDKESPFRLMSEREQLSLIYPILVHQVLDQVMDAGDR
ncbi:MAG: hypothetical protein KDC03_16200 [Flavobacteriales bacterium]|nr:hypothetical protein [Flavobacteriales bacterium]